MVLYVFTILYAGLSCTLYTVQDDDIHYTEYYLQCLYLCSYRILLTVSVSLFLLYRILPINSVCISVPTGSGGLQGQDDDIHHTEA